MELSTKLSCNMDTSGTDHTNDSTAEVASGRPPVKKPRQTKKEFWQDFEPYRDLQDLKRAKCKFCDSDNACDSSKAGTSNLSRHWEKCKLNPRNQGKGTQTQLTLESSGDNNVRMRNWTFDAKYIRDYVVRMVVRDEMTFSSVEKIGMREAFFAAQPLYTMPSRNTIRRDCFHLYLKERDKLKELFKTSCVSVCLTTDTWTSVSNDNYTCVTAHWVDDKWVLQKRIINFFSTSTHTGESIGMAIEDCLRFWGLSSKLLAITVDNVGANDVACNFVKEKAKKRDTITKGEYLHVRCIAHIINLIVQDGMSVGGKHITKIRAMTKYVRGSPSRLHTFRQQAELLEIEYKTSLKNDVPTRWNSTYLMLDSVLKYKIVFERMDIPALREGSELGPMTTSDWERCESLRMFLKEFYDLTNRISGSLYVTSNWLVFHIGVCAKLVNDLIVGDDIDMSLMGFEMKKKYDKYFGEMSKMNLLLFVAALLDPYHKMRGVKNVLKGLFGETDLQKSVKDVKDFAYKLFDAYKALLNPPDNQGSQVRQSGESEEADWIDYFEDEDYECEEGLRSEFDLYLADRTEQKKTNVLEWWVKNHQRYPILARMARDVLAIPISTVPSESAFSTGRRTISDYRSSLKPEMVQALICTQDWLRASARNENINGHEDDSDEDVPKEVLESTFYAC